MENKKKKFEDIITQNNIIYATPEYITGENGLAFVKKAWEMKKLMFVAIDEAHCVAEW